MPPVRADYAPLEGYDPGERLRRKVAETAVRKAGLFPGDRTLELACGPGLLAVPVARAFTRCRAVGVDARAEAGERFARNARAEGATARATFVRGEPTALPFPDETFHFGLSAFALGNLDDPLEALAELHRVMAYYGKILLFEADLTRAVKKPRGLARRVVDADVEEAMREMGYGKIHRQKVDVLPGGGFVELVAAKRFDPDEGEPEDGDDGEDEA